MPFVAFRRVRLLKPRVCAAAALVTACIASPGVGTTLDLADPGEGLFSVGVTVIEKATSTRFTISRGAIPSQDHADFINTRLTFEPVGVLAPSAAITELMLEFGPFSVSGEIGATQEPLVVHIEGVRWSFVADPGEAISIERFSNHASFPSRRLNNTTHVADVSGTLSFLGASFPFFGSSSVYCRSDCGRISFAALGDATDATIIANIPAPILPVIDGAHITEIDGIDIKLQLGFGRVEDAVFAVVPEASGFRVQLLVLSTSILVANRSRHLTRGRVRA